jgi:hypothetical protein
MVVRLLVTFAILLCLLGGLLFIDRPFVRFDVTADSTGTSYGEGPWVSIENQGMWDAANFGFGCGLVEAKDADGKMLINRRGHLTLLTASSQLRSKERRKHSCSLEGEKLAGDIHEAVMVGSAHFELRYWPLIRARSYEITLKRNPSGKMQVASIRER